MNRHDIVKITKIVEDFHAGWPERITQAMIDDGLYGVYLRTTYVAPVVSVNSITYYIPEESLEVVDNIMILFTTLRGAYVRIVSYNGELSLTANNELSSNQEESPFLEFESHEAAKKYIRENIQILKEY